MPRPIRLYPIPSKRYYGSRWQILWRWKGVQYIIKTDYREEKKPALANADLRKIEIALSQDDASFPARYQDDPAVIRYIENRYPKPDDQSTNPIMEHADILPRYQENLQTHCAKNWASTSYAFIRKLDGMTEGGILATTPVQAGLFLEKIMNRELGGVTSTKKAKPSVATRNRALAVFSRFFRWINANGLVIANPFSGYKTLKEVETGRMIVYCTEGERARVLAAAQELGRSDWLAFPIALYAGLRREEVFHLHWEDLNFETRRISVWRKTKTGKKRFTPICKELDAIFTLHKKERGLIVERVEGQTWENQAERLIESVRCLLCRPENPDLSGDPWESKSKMRFLNTEDELLAVTSKLIELDKDFQKERKLGSGSKVLRMAMKVAGQQGCSAKAHDGKEWVPAERIGWNAFRHTFATLRAQRGVSLDKVSSWMGNTYAVCKMHYAEFMPRDSFDKDIDK